MRRERMLVLSFLVAAALLQSTAAFSAFHAPLPHTRHHAIGPLYSTTTSSDSKTTTTTEAAVDQKDPDQWIEDSLEKYDRCVIGPKEVLVYDTTLRGMFS